MRLWLLRQAHPDLSKLELEVSTSCLSKISLLRLLLGQTNRDKDFPESLRYSVFPNISFLAGTFLMGSKVWAEGISINYQQQINFSSGEVSGNFVDYRLNSTAINSVYGASDTNQPEAVRVLSLVKAY